MKKTTNAPMFKFNFKRYKEEQGYEISLLCTFIKPRNTEGFRIIDFNCLT